MLNQIKEKYYKSDFIRNILTLLTGTTIAQAIPIIISPVLTRLYSPEDFGAWAIFMSLSGIIAVIASLRFEMAIMLPKDDDDAANIVALSVMLAAVISLIALLLTFFFNDFFVRIFNFNGNKKLLYLIGITVFFTAIYQVFNLYSIRQKTFRRNAAARISQTATTSGINLALGTFNTGAFGLIFGQFTGQLSSAFILCWKYIANYKNFRNKISKKKIKENLKRYRNFARINSPHAFLDTFQDSGIFLIITHYFSSSVLGFYSFAFRVLKVPVGFIGSAIYQVFYEKAAREKNENKNLRPLLLRMYKNLFVMGLPLFLVLFFFSPQLFSFIFGENWRVAGEIARIITPWLFVNFIASPVSSIPVIINRQFGAMLFTIADIILKISSLVIGAFLGSFKISFIIMSASCSLLLIAAIIWYYSIARNVEDRY